MYRLFTSVLVIEPGVETQSLFITVNVTADSYIYHFSSIKTSWAEANDYCINWGGLLTSILSHDEAQTLIDNM